MTELIPEQFVYLAGTGFFVLLGIVIVTIIQEFIRYKWRNGKGNRRQDNRQEWPSQMLLHLHEIDLNIRDINKALTNGLSDKIDNVLTVVHKCHELNTIRDHEMRVREDR